ncbi:hypothetical protein B0H19DRAFT_637280 [Mycena capillaripes]|nr:hypothetical protein B0H19DRAFT_637280 [Mycena capillaripes]
MVDGLRSWITIRVVLVAESFATTVLSLRFGQILVLLALRVSIKKVAHAGGSLHWCRSGILKVLHVTGERSVQVCNGASRPRRVESHHVMTRTRFVKTNVDASAGSGKKHVFSLAYQKALETAPRGQQGPRMWRSSYNSMFRRCDPCPSSPTTMAF